MDTQSIAVTATFTADPLGESLAFWMRELGLPLASAFAPYGQVFQQLLDRSSLLGRNEGGINLVLVRAEDWQRESGALAAWSDAAEARIERSLDELIAALVGASAQARAPLFVAMCPPSAAAVARHGAFFERIAARFTSSMESHASIHVITEAERAALYPTSVIDDPHGDELGHIPYTRAYFAALGTLVARKIHALRSPPRKVIAVDCDDTLWGGIVGEVGPMGVELDAPRQALQRRLVAQKDGGMLVCVVSKNDERDVLDVWKNRPEMPLRRDDIVAMRVNWLRKSDNLRSLATELALGLDSFVFLDDNPIECADVAASCPEVLAIELPRAADAASIPAFINHVWALDRLRVTAEDTQRTKLYQRDAERERTRKEAPTLEAFVAGLNVDVAILPLGDAPAKAARFAQLTQRTNQFNCTTIRRTEPEVVELLRSSDTVVLLVGVSDRFGDYGAVGALVARPRDAALEVETFLLSCRALGRGVENRMLRHLGALAIERGLARVDVHFVPTPKNQPARDFLDGAGAAHAIADGNAIVYRFPASVAAELSVAPFVVEPRAAERPETMVKTFGPSAPSALMNRIARELRDVDAILAAIGVERKRASAAESPPAKPAEGAAVRTPVEDAVTVIWTEVLAIEPIEVDQDFFELGGDSLTAAQVVSRLRQSFHVHLPLDVIFDRRTIASLAVTIVDALTAEQGAGDDVTGLLDELEGR